MLQGLKIAFALYSQVPIFNIKWEAKNMRYVFCFFPMVGFVLGLLMYLYVQSVSAFLKGDVFSLFFAGAIFFALPILYTGGIHLDGLLDTQDALSSHKEMEKKLEILKDPQAGAFAVIACGVYLIIELASLCCLLSIFINKSQLALPLLYVFCLKYPLSRSFSGLSVTTFPMAKNTGLAYTFSSNADKTNTRKILIAYIVLISVIALFINIIFGLTLLITTVVVFAYYYYMSLKQFGGITGDLCGWFLQMAELLVSIALIFSYYYIAS